MADHNEHVSPNAPPGAPDSSQGIADRHGSEAGLFLAFFDDAPIGKCMTAPDGRLLRVNRAFCEMLGYTSEEMQGLAFPTITHPDDLEVSRHCVTSLLAGEKEVWDFEKRYLGKDGRVVWTRVVTRLQRDADATPLLFMTHITDIGDRKRAEEQLRDAVRKLEHVNRVVRSIRSINQLIVRERHPGRLLQRTCDLLVQTRGYHGAWAALGREGQPPTEIAEAGWGVAFDVLRSELANGRWPGCRSLAGSSAKTAVVLEPSSACRECPLWASYRHDRAAAIPLRVRGEIVGLLAVAVEGDLEIDAEEQDLLVEVAEDVSFALESIENEARSQETQRQLSRLFETMAQGVVRQDGAGRITAANPAAQRILGLSLDEMTGRTSMDPRWKAVREDGSDFPGDQHYATVTLRTGEPSQGLMGVFNPRVGEYRWIHVHAVPEAGGDGGPHGVFSTFDDVTALRAAEAKARHERDRAQQYLDIAGSMLVAVDRDGIVQMINPAGCAILGLPAGEVVGKDWFRAFVPPDRRAEVSGVSQAVLAEDPGAACFENPVVTRSGEERLIAWTNAVIRDGAGAVVGHLSSGQDVTEQRLAERLLRVRLDLVEYATGHSLEELLQRTVDVVCEISSSPIGFYHFVTHDEKALTLQAWSTRTRVEYCKAEGEGMHYPVDKAGVWADCVRRREVVIHNDYATLEGRRGLPEGHAELTRELVVPVFREGRIVAVLGVGNKSYDYDRRDVDVVTFLADVGWEIASRKRTEERLKATEQQLAQSRRLEAIGRLAGGIAHDFNNLLTVIQGSAAFLAQELPKGDPSLEDVHHIAEAGHRAAKLTHQLLAFSRKQVFKPEVFDLNDVVKRMDSMLRRLIGEDIDFRTVLQRDLWLVSADAGQLEQVIMNLAVNARDAMPKGGHLTFETANVEVDETFAASHADAALGPYVMLAVTDDGVGMPAEVRDRVFEPFFSTKPAAQGTGLGLATVWGIVKQSEGNVWVYSEPGQGTTFKVFLPKAGAEAKTMRPRTPAPQSSTGTETVLVVEDDVAIQAVMARILRSGGYRVFTVSGGRQALALCREGTVHVDLLVTDVVMPEMSGKQVADGLVGIIPGLKVVYMSGYTDNAIVHHGVLDEGVRLIAKPFSAETVLRAVREALDDETSVPPGTPGA